MTQVTQTPTPTECRVSKDTGVGNTKATPIRSRTWIMTWNNYTDDERDTFVTWAKENCIDFAINEEQERMEQNIYKFTSNFRTQEPSVH